MSFRIDRRTALKGVAAASVAAVAGLPLRRASAAPSDRKFLFLFASGGWDTAQVFEPKFGLASGVDLPPDSYLGETAGLRYVAGDDRPEVARYFERWGHRTATINGIDTHSIGHGSGTRFVLSGSSASTLPDWPTRLAAASTVTLPMPHVVFSGPAFAGTLGASVVRGGDGRLLELIDGSVVGRATEPVPAPSSPVDAMIDAVVYEQSARRERTSLQASQLTSLERAMELEGRLFEARLDSAGSSLLDRSTRAVELMRLGLARCAMVRIPGSWDTHSNNARQTRQFASLFSTLDRLQEHLATTPGDVAPTLADEVVVVALSELGRTPRLNGGGGKDHWPFTSALVVGPGVAGGQTIGATDDGLRAVAIDYATGRPSSSGDILGCESIGAALLRLGGLDPELSLQGVQVLDALLA